MAEKDSQGPSLELPSLFKRKHSSDSGRADTAATPPADTSSTAATASSDDTAVLPTAQPEAPEAPAPQSPPPARPAPGSGDGAGESERPAERRPQLTLPSVRAPRAGRRDRETDRPAASDAGTPTSPAAEGASGPAPEAAAAAPAEAPTREQEPVAPQAPAAPTPAPAASAPAGTAPAAPAGPTPVPAATRVAAPESDAAPRTGDQRSPKRERGRPTLPALAATTAALVVGAAVGLLGVVLTFLGLRGCELVAGTSSCGGPGLLVLVAIFVAMVLAGGAALKLFGVPEAGSVSFLGTGLLMVVLLFFFLDALDHPSMLIVIPAIAALCFAVARWVTTQLSEDVMAER